jgi:hypothetical protein
MTGRVRCGKDGQSRFRAIRCRARQQRIARSGCRGPKPLAFHRVPIGLWLTNVVRVASGGRSSAERSRRLRCRVRSGAVGLVPCWRVGEVVWRIIVGVVADLASPVVVLDRVCQSSKVGWGGAREDAKVGMAAGRPRAVRISWATSVFVYRRRASRRSRAIARTRTAAAPLARQRSRRGDRTRGRPPRFQHPSRRRRRRRTSGTSPDLPC